MQGTPVASLLLTATLGVGAVPCTTAPSQANSLLCQEPNLLHAGSKWRKTMAYEQRRRGDTSDNTYQVRPEHKDK